MRLETVIQKIEAQIGLDQFLDFVEREMRLGKSAQQMAAASSVKIGEAAMIRMIDLWYPGYTDLKVVDRRKWICNTYPTLYLERHASLTMYRADHPYFKHFTKRNFVNYYAQKSMATKRGVEFKFDFHGWILWWLLTGHFDERGPANHQYQMCRLNDTGAYEWDNIYCDTGLQNRLDYRSGVSK